MSNANDEMAATSMLGGLGGIDESLALADADAEEEDAAKTDDEVTSAADDDD